MENPFNNLEFQRFTTENWGVERRLEFIEFRLFWEERINRGDLTAFFGISTPQASKDLAKYQELAPGNIEYDKRGKFYFATKEFRPAINPPNSERYLAYLRFVSYGINRPEETFIGSFPDYDMVPVVERPVEPNMLRRILAAIRNNSDLDIYYQSMSRPEPIWRLVCPHALGFDGFRWNIRGYCHTRKNFIDFSIGRIIEIGEERPSDVDAKSDTLWHSIKELKIGPHPELSEGQKKIIEHEYGMKNGCKEIKVREAFLFYFLKRYGLSKKVGNKEPKGQHIVLLNPEEAGLSNQ